MSPFIETTGKPRRNERGAVAVEFALVLPLLILLVFGVIQWGLVMAQSAALSGGARNGARYGVVNIVSARTCSDVVSQVRGNSGTIGMTGTQVGVTVQLVTGSTTSTVCSSAANSSTVTPSAGASTLPCKASSDTSKLSVTATYDAPSLLPIGTGAFSLQGQGTYRCEYK